MISVIMSVYNEPISLIEQSVRSILQQSLKDFELIVVIDAPNRKELIDCIDRISRQDKRIVKIINKQNVGLTASLNKAVDLAKGEYIARMDADDCADPKRLEKELGFLLKNDLDLVGCDIVNMDMNGKNADTPTIYPKGPESIKEYLRYNSPMAHPTWLGKVELFKNNKYIDFPACEDYEFLVRLALQGKRIDNLGDVLLRYRLNDSGVSSTKRAIQKTSLSYVRRNYKKGMVSNYSDYIQYLDSSKGKHKTFVIEKYYKTTKKMKDYKKQKNFFAFARNGITLLCNPYFYESMYCLIKSKRIQKRAGRNR